MEYKVTGDDGGLYASGFFGDQGKDKAQKLIDSGYFHKHLMPELKNVKLTVVEVK